jgi:hypothetical protein
MVTGKASGLLNVTLGDAVPWHTEVVPVIVAAGVGNTVRVALADVSS